MTAEVLVSSIAATKSRVSIIDNRGERLNPVPEVKCLGCMIHEDGGYEMARWGQRAIPTFQTDPVKIIVTEEEELYKQFCRQRYNKFLPYCFYTVKKIFIYIVIQFH